MTVGIPTFISMIIAFLSVIFVLLVINKKPSKIETDKMKEAGMEVAEEIQRNAEKYIEKIEKQKHEIDKKLEQMKRIQYLIQTGEAEVNLERATPKTTNQKTEIISLHEEGYSVEQISKILDVQKGIVEVSLNMGTLKKHG